MKQTMDVFGYHKPQYLEQVRRWANRLCATDVTVHLDHSVTLYEGDDCICYRYKPSAKELANRR